MLWICCPAGFLDNNGSVAAVRLRDSPPILSSEEMIEQFLPQLQMWQQFSILLKIGSSFVLRISRPGKDDLPVAGPEGQRHSSWWKGRRWGRLAPMQHYPRCIIPASQGKRDHLFGAQEEESQILQMISSGKCQEEVNQTSSLLLSCQGHHHPALRKPHGGLLTSNLVNGEYTKQPRSEDQTTSKQTIRWDRSSSHPRPDQPVLLV
jgi:hypothetical protein